MQMKLSTPLYNPFPDHIYSRVFACLCAREISSPRFSQGLTLNPSPAWSLWEFYYIIDMTHSEDAESEEKILELPVVAKVLLFIWRQGPLPYAIICMLHVLGFAYLIFT